MKMFNAFKRDIKATEEVFKNFTSLELNIRLFRQNIPCLILRIYRVLCFFITPINGFILKKFLFLPESKIF